MWKLLKYVGLSEEIKKLWLSWDERTFFSNQEYLLSSITNGGMKIVEGFS